ncbi:MAG: TonB-dependent receptor [Cyclobacteriaceae bacterium]|nr:TonB-dependent receptor [Cyclobacteriaceae bacterium]MDW8331538.1 TonB-dependent receptor [Cyclobacteriaceae bacterium]
MAQTTISGKVKDETGTPMPGVNIVVAGTTDGTVSDQNGDFSLSTQKAPPFKLRFSFIGYRTKEVEISGAASNLDISMEADPLGLDEVVIIGQGVRSDFLSAPVSAYRVGALDIRQVPTPDFYEAVAYQPGVQMLAGSINFQSMNTRGFATVANTRFVQWVDGMDTAAPILNFPTGNLVGISELDAESIDLLPGASSALFGPNAFNGIIVMTSKSPFEYQGLSLTAKGGITTSEAQDDIFPQYNFAMRYAKAFNNKFAFKVNFSWTDITDWKGNDYTTHRPDPDNPILQTGRPDFDGLNLYGDETVINVPIPGFSPITRTGWREEDIIDSYNAGSIKADGALHYKFNPNLELIYAYRYGGGNSIYQGSEKYAIRDFNQQFHKLELKGKNFFVRSYMTQTNAGNSYNMSALGAFMNERYAPSASQWVPDYILAYNGAITGVTPGDHAAARAYADRNRPAPGTTAFRDLVEGVRNDYFQRNPPGAKFIDKSRLYHAEFNYRFDDIIKWAEVQIGGNFRRYDLFSDATVYNEDVDGDGKAEGIKIDEYGAYIQIAKQLGNLKLTGSVRHDKNENFDGLFTPRLSAVYSVNQNNFIRASFQTGFRNPDTQAQFIYFPTGGGILLGSTRANAERYGVHEGGAYTLSSYQAFRASGGSLAPDGTPVGGNPALLETANVPYIRPERLQSIEVGYKGSFNNRLLVDVFGFFNSYKDFIGDQLIVSKNPTTHKGATVPPGTIWSPYVNSPEKVTSWGSGVNISYTFLKGYIISANYTYQDYDANESDEFIAGFNTPRNRYMIGLSNRNIGNSGFGFNVNFRWQETFFWNSGFSLARDVRIPEYGVLDAMVSYKITSIKGTLKLGGTNLLGGDYRPNFGSGFVGQQYYLSITFDDLFK